MPQYSNSFVLQEGGTVNAVFNTESNTITYTVTAPQGQIATLTLPPDSNPQSVENVNNIRQQIRNQGGSALTIAGFGRGLQAVQFNTKEEASRVENTATATNTTVPANPTPPPPVTPATPVEPVIVNTPPTNDNVVNPNTDPNLNLGNETETVTSQQPTNISLGTNALNEFATDTNLAIGINTQINDFDTDLRTQQEINENQDAAVTAGGGEDETPNTQGVTGVADNENVEDNVENNSVALVSSTDPNLADLEAGDNLVESDEDITKVNQTSLSSIRGDIDDLDEVENNNNIRQLSIQGDDTDEDQAPNIYGNSVSNTDPSAGQVTNQQTSQSSVESGSQAPYSVGGARGISGSLNSAQNQAALQQGNGFSNIADWRVKLKLAKNANYLYAAPVEDRGILAPLAETDGVVFPYTPQISVMYAASYEPTAITHSNYKIAQYQSSSVDTLQITCDFTAQDNTEATYLLAVIHFFRSVTKMFYGQDENPKPGTPPPLCYLVGMGAFQFDLHPLVVTSFQYNLPDDVDYIRAIPNSASVARTNSSSNTGNSNLQAMGIQPGGVASGVAFSTPPTGQSVEPTYVPTKMKITLSCMPIVSRGDISDVFSLKDYGSGKIYRGSTRASGGIW